MRMNQIMYYFWQFDLTLKKGGYFYSKQWKEGLVLFENVKILQKDYPLSKNWSCIVPREAAVQARFFEALYKNSINVFMNLTALKQKIMDHLEWSMLRWALVGFSTFLIDYVIFINLYQKLPLLVANFISITIAVCYNFYLHKVWTFDHSMENLSSIVRYTTALFFNYVINTSVVKLAFILGVPPFFGKFLAAAISAPVNYFVLRLFVFKS
jgi:putative flippase GtrA